MPALTLMCLQSSARKITLMTCKHSPFLFLFTCTQQDSMHPLHSPISKDTRGIWQSKTTDLKYLLATEPRLQQWFGNKVGLAWQCCAGLRFGKKYKTRLGLDHCGDASSSRWAYITRRETCLSRRSTRQLSNARYYPWSNIGLTWNNARSTYCVFWEELYVQDQ